MLLAHLVPGYFAAALTKPHWDSAWGFNRRAVLWGVALASTAIPDLDVVYNASFRGFINHSTLWTHSIFVYAAIAVIWLILYLSRRWFYWPLIVGFIAVGGLSHIVLDVLSHGSPLFYPVSMWYVGIAPQRVVVGGFWAYITDPIFLLEPLLISCAWTHFIWHLRIERRVRWIGVGATVGSFVAFSILFLLYLPGIQAAVLSRIVP